MILSRRSPRRRPHGKNEKNSRLLSILISCAPASRHEGAGVTERRFGFRAWSAASAQAAGRRGARPQPQPPSAASRARDPRASRNHTCLVDTDRRSRARRRWSATDRGRSLNLRTPYLLYSTVHGSPRISHGGRGSGGRAVPVPVAPDGRSLDRDLDALRERRAMSVPCVELRKLTMNSCFIVSSESCLCVSV